MTHVVVSDVRQTLPQVAREPVLGLPCHAVEAGTVKQHHERTALIPVMNHGAGGPDLVVQARCNVDWIAVSPAQLSVRAGEHRCFEVQLLPDANAASGEFVIPIAIESPNAAMESKGQVELRARVVQDVFLRAEPTAVHIGETEVGTTVERSVSLTRSDGKVAQPRVLRFQGESGFAHSVKYDVIGNEVVITLETANRTVGHHEGTLVIVDRDPDVTKIEVPLSVDIVDAASVTCEASCGFNTNNLTGEVTIQVGNVGTVPIAISVTSQAEWLQPARNRAITVEPRSTAPVTLAYDMRQVRETTATASLLLGIETVQGRVVRKRIAVSLQRAVPAIEAGLRGMIGRIVPGRPKRVSIILNNRGDGEAYVYVRKAPEWLSIPDEKMVVAARSKREVIATILLPPEMPAMVAAELTLAWNAAIDGPDEIAIPLAFEVAQVGTPRPVSRRQGERSGLPLASIIALALALAAGGMVMRARPWERGLSARDTPEPPIEPPPTAAPSEPPTAPLSPEQRRQFLSAAYSLKHAADQSGSLELKSKAAAGFGAVLDTRPNDQAAMWGLAWTLADLGREDRIRAIELFRQFIAVSDDTGVEDMKEFVKLDDGVGVSQLRQLARDAIVRIEAERGGPSEQ